VGIEHTQKTDSFTPEWTTDPRSTLRGGQRPATPPVVLGSSAPLKLGKIIGEGGMGIINEARQPSLNRILAVKRARDPKGRPKHTQALMAEARVTGAVSHPNVVPVHDLIRGADGMPQLLLKRIEGRAWNTLMRDPQAVDRLYGEPDVVRFHVEILEQVCAAVHAAHARSILHRDLKPGNVMIGTRRQVYLLDWGLGVAFDDNASPDLPRQAPGAKGAGTPHYMAPEMVSDRFGQLGPWSDVYLLGGLLFHILYGRPPHSGTSVWNMLIAACKNDVRVPEIGPPELVDLCRRCLLRRHQERVQDAETVRRELRDWLDHRASIALAEEADDHARALMSHSQTHTGWSRTHQLFGAAVFGYQRALADWPHNLRAERGLLTVVRWMVQYELDDDQPDAAATAMSYLAEPPNDLDELVRTTLITRDHRRARRDRLARFILHDDERGTQSLRVLMVATTGAFAIRTWSGLANLGSAQLTVQLADLAAILLVLGAIGTTWASLTRSQINRQLAAFAVFFVTGQSLLTAGLHTMPLSAEQGQILHIGVTLMLVTLATLSLDRRLLPSAVMFAVALVASSLFPALTAWFQCSAYAVLGAQIVGIRWHPAITTLPSSDGRPRAA
jgi:serine/threonine protein kinase